MDTNTLLYRSILSRLGSLATEQLAEVDSFLRSLTERRSGAAEEPTPLDEERVRTMMSYAGAWSDMSDDDLNEFLREAKRAGNEAFSREVDL